MISVIIPANNERYLSKTIDDLYAKSIDDIEIIVILDGSTEYPITSYSEVTVLKNDYTKGVRHAINKAVEISTGDYILKTDAHCMFGWGYDKKLQNDCEDNWISVARRYTLDLGKWERAPRTVDYYYLSCPWTHPKFMMQSCPWISKTEEQYGSSKDIDDLMCFQGSMWFMSKKHWNWLGGLDTSPEYYAEHHELSMRTWLGGGRVVINKNAWYAHPKGGTRGYHMSMRQVYKDHTHSAGYWMTNSWERQIYNYEWLIDKFWPLPTQNNKHVIEKYYWPDDWKTEYDRVMRDRFQIQN